MALPGGWSQLSAEVEFRQANLEVHKLEDLAQGGHHQNVLVILEPA